MCHTAAEARRPRLTCGLATAFGCTIEGAVDEDRVRRIAVEVAEAGADAIILADTVGYGQPAAIERVFRRVMADVAPLPVGGHFHDTRGLGLANVLAALQRRRALVRRLARAGSAAAPTRRARPATSSSRTLVFMLEAMGFDTGIDLDRLVEVRELVHGALPNVVQYGAIAKAGLPKNFHARRSRKRRSRIAGRTAATSPSHASGERDPRG